MQSPEHFTLKQVADSIRKTIESRYSRTYWVTAEMHKLNQTRKGHCYPELVGKEGDQIVVEMRGTIWKNNFENIQRRFTEVVREPLRDGLELLFHVKIVYHPIYNLGLEIIDIDPNYTLGALQRERQETLERLNKEGILNANQQLQLALVPKRLAIISQADSKGYSDFTVLLNGHPKRYHFTTFLFEATLQGDAAIASITGQLERIRKVKQHFDAVVIIRGGGGEIGMHCYNNYELAKTIATFPLPVLTGIGHSTNLTVCEMIAFNNGITPSDLAYWLLRIFEELDAPLDRIRVALPALSGKALQEQYTFFAHLMRHFQSETRQAISSHRNAAGALIKDFHRITDRAVYNNHTRIDGVRNELRSAVLNKRSREVNLLDLTRSRMALLSENLVGRKEQKVRNLGEQLERSLPSLFRFGRQQLETIEHNLHLINPERVMERGYAIVTNEKGIIGKKNIPTRGQRLIIQRPELTVIATTQLTEGVDNMED